MYVDFYHCREGWWIRSANRWGGTAGSKPKAQKNDREGWKARVAALCASRIS